MRGLIMNKTELKDMVQNLEHCRWLTTRIMTAQLEENISPCDFEYNMQILASDIDDECIHLQAIIDSLPDDDTKEGK